jgi:uncharacterized protein
MISRNEPNPENVDAHLERLAGVIADYESMVVACSGGVDSALLARVASDVLGERMIAAIGVSASLADRELRDARAFFETHAIAWIELAPGEMNDPRYRANGPDRCFFCKEALFDAIAAHPSTSAFAVVAYGANLDDGDDYRPGAQSASNRGVVAPLARAGFTKAMVRSAARTLSLEVWDKPAAPCLASRIPYATEVTPERLRRIEAAEVVLDRLGFRERRVRLDGGTAHVELPLADHGRATRADVWPQIEKGIRAAGFADVVLVSDGLRSGRLNDALGRTT